MVVSFHSLLFFRWATLPRLLCFVVKLTTSSPCSDKEPVMRHWGRSSSLRHRNRNHTCYLWRLWCYLLQTLCYVTARHHLAYDLQKRHALATCDIFFSLILDPDLFSNEHRGFSLSNKTIVTLLLYTLFNNTIQTIFSCTLKIDIDYLCRLVPALDSHSFC